MRRALLCFIFLALGVEAAFDVSGRAVLLRPALLPPPPRGGRHVVKRAAASPQCMMQSPWPTNQQQQRKSAAARCAVVQAAGKNYAPSECNFSGMPPCYKKRLCAD